MIGYEPAVACTALSLVSCFVYVYVRYPFWHRQPVMHSYFRLLYWFSSTPTVLEQWPYKHKRYFVPEAKTEDVNDASWTPLAALLKKHWIPSDRLYPTFTPTLLQQRFVGSEQKSWVSHSETAFVTSRSTTLHCFNEAPTVSKAYYTDFLVAEDGDAARRLFHTHQYRVRCLEPDVKTGVWRRDGPGYDGVIPLVRFSSYSFLLEIPPNAFPLSSGYEVVSIKTHMSLLYDFVALLKEPTYVRTLFGEGALLLLCADLGTMLAQIASGEMMIYALRRRAHWLGFYFFRRSRVLYEEVGQGKDSVACVGTVCNCDSDRVFYLGYMDALRQLITLYPDIGVLHMDALGPSSMSVVDRWRRCVKPFATTESAYYGYNFVWSALPLDPKQCWVCV